MKLMLVYGGRDFSDYVTLCSALDNLKSMISEEWCVLNGAAKGADKLSSQWASSRGVPYLEAPALWDAQGRAAGVLRNEFMAKLKPFYAVEFPGGRGTIHMRNLLTRQGVTIYYPLGSAS
jgi:hypothetical protein